MSPAEQRELNIAYFQQLLRWESDPQKRAHIEGQLAAERVKPDHAYPADRTKRDH